MELNELVKIRRSIRDYKECEISLDDIKEMIKCAQLAPSWKNVQASRYIVIHSKEEIEKFRPFLPSFNQNNSKNAAYIITSFKKGLSGYNGGNPSDELEDKWGAYDLGLQNAYFLLKASELGYDTLIMGLRYADQIREYYNIPEDEDIMGVIAVGKRNKDTFTANRKELDEIAKFY